MSLKSSGLCFLCMAFIFCFLESDVSDAMSARAMQKRVPLRIASLESHWERFESGELLPDDGVRTLFELALLYAETGVHFERLERLFELGEKMQDRTPERPTHGNFGWFWRDGNRVTDRNAIEFVMQDAIPIWSRHRDQLSPLARKRLERILRRAIDGCQKHWVPSEYTNIAIFNAGNLIALGNLFNDREAIGVGLERMRKVLYRTYEYGIAEYNSDAYAAVDLDGLYFIIEFSQNPKAILWAKKLLELFWTDIACSWHKASGRLAGSQSRTYDYLYGTGAVNRYAALTGLLKEPYRPTGQLVRHAWTEVPSKKWFAQFQGAYPQELFARWGTCLSQCRWMTKYRNIALGTAGAQYGNTDMPLVVNLAGNTKTARAYFIADGRKDPYGKKKFSTGHAKHLKAVHLTPFWSGVQRKNDALGWVLYSKEKLEKSPKMDALESHFVLPKHFESLRIDGKSVAAIDPDANKEKKSVAQLKKQNAKSYVFRYGDSAIGVRVVWSRNLQGKECSVRLVDDGNPWQVVRLTVNHGLNGSRIAPNCATSPHCDTETADAGVVFWVRIGTDFKCSKDFEKWAQQFESTLPEVLDVNEKQMRVQVAGEDGKLGLSVFPLGDSYIAQSLPRPCDAILRINGKDKGRKIFESLDPIQEYLQLSKKQKAGKAILVAADANVTEWDASSGTIGPGFAIKKTNKDVNAVSLNESSYPSSLSKMTYRLQLEKPGTYHLYARILAPDSRSDSLRLSWRLNGIACVPQMDWHVGVTKKWTWKPLKRNESEILSVTLPAGESCLEIYPRESGIMISSLRLKVDHEMKGNL